MSTTAIPPAAKMQIWLNPCLAATRAHSLYTSHTINQHIGIRFNPFDATAADPLFGYQIDGGAGEAAIRTNVVARVKADVDAGRKVAFEIVAIMQQPLDVDQVFGGYPSYPTDANLLTGWKAGEYLTTYVRSLSGNLFTNIVNDLNGLGPQYLAGIDHFYADTESNYVGNAQIARLYASCQSDPTALAMMSSIQASLGCTQLQAFYYQSQLAIRTAQRHILSAFPSTIPIVSWGDASAIDPTYVYNYGAAVDAHSTNTTSSNRMYTANVAQDVTNLSADLAARITSQPFIPLIDGSKTVSRNGSMLNLGRAAGLNSFIFYATTTTQLDNNSAAILATSLSRAGSGAGGAGSLLSPIRGRSWRLMTGLRFRRI